MGIIERKLRHKEEIKASILKAAWKIVRLEGWHALSIRKIADAIEYSVPVIYDHFENKEAIMLEFTKQGFQQLNTELEKAKAKAQGSEDQIKAIADAYWKFAFNNKEYYQLMYGVGIPPCETVKQIPELNLFTDTILETIKNLIAKSKNKDADPVMKLQSLWSMLHGLVSINMMNKANKKNMNEKILEDFILNFLAGLRTKN